MKLREIENELKRQEMIKLMEIQAKAYELKTRNQYSKLNSRKREINR